MATIKDFVDNETKNGIELFSDEKVVCGKNGATAGATGGATAGATLTRNTEKLRQISLGAISSNDSKEWYLVCRLNAPVGTILEDYDDSYWENKYNEIITLCRLELTKALLTERNTKSAKVLLDILMRRDKEHWSDSKTVDVKTNDTDKTIAINIVSV